MYERDFCHRKARLNNSPEMWAKYKSLRNKVTASIKYATNCYYADLSNMFPNEPKKLWKELSRIVGNKKKDNAVPPSLTCHKFKEYFANIGSNLTASLPNPGELTLRNPPCIYSFSFNTIEEACVMKQLKSLPPESHLVKLWCLVTSAICDSIIEPVTNQWYPPQRLETGQGNPYLQRKVSQNGKVKF